MTLLDFRRRVGALYQQVREQSVTDPAGAHRRWVTGRDELYAGHPDSALGPRARAGFTGLPTQPYDPALRHEVAVRPGPGERMQVATGTDGTVTFDRIGLVDLGGLGTLDVWWRHGYGGGLFLPVADPSPDTYGGGRYLLDTVKGADLGGRDDVLVVDLNFAYNPSCAYDPAWACPLAPAGNRLSVPLTGGERYPEGGWPAG